MPKVKKTPSSDDMIVYFATNRTRLDNTGFGMDAAPGAEASLLLGQVAVERIGDPGRTEQRRDLVASPAITGTDDFANPKAGSAAKLLDAWLSDAASRKGVAVLFIHGFSNGFNSAVQRAAQLVEFYDGAGVRLVPLAYCWPSDGKVIAPGLGGDLIGGALEQYRLDQRDAAASAPALARLLAHVNAARLRQSAQAAAALRIVLLAHSMGNHALAAGLLALDNGLMTKAMRGMFATALLMASDVSAEALMPGKSLRKIADLAGSVTVGVSHDPMLSVASRIANGNRRLGHAGPVSLDGLPANLQVVDYWFGLEAGRPERLRAIGCTEYDDVGHQWYRNDLNARADLALAFAGAVPEKRRRLAAAEQTQAERTRHMVLVQ